MDKLKITVNEDKSIELHFGSWVMGQLIKRGWGYTVTAVLDEMTTNPYDSNALIVYLGQCSAAKKSLSLDEFSLDEAYDIVDEINRKDVNESNKIYDSFIISMFGEEVLEKMKAISLEAI